MILSTLLKDEALTSEKKTTITLTDVYAMTTTPKQPTACVFQKD